MANKKQAALSPQARENQMISLSMDLAEQKLRDGTASSQLIVHFLKLGTEQAKLEQEKLKNENELLKSKKDAIESEGRIEELYINAMNAMKSYRGTDDD